MLNIAQADPSCFSACLSLSHGQEDIGSDPFLRGLLRAPGEPFRLLDVGCGAGHYLHAQIQAYQALGLEAIGVDSSPKMLHAAREAGIPAEFRLGSAEALPIPDAYFDVVVCRLSFHLFNKSLALDEMLRVCKRGGSILIDELAPGQMPAWWPFHFFPRSEALTHSLFWPPEKICQALKRRGCKAAYALEFGELAHPLAALLSAAKVRDLPHLLFLDDESFREGIASLETEEKRAAQAEYRYRASIVRVIATKNMSA